MPTVGIVLDPRLGLRAEDVVRAWNGDPQGQRAGLASVPDGDEALDFSPAVDAVQIVIDLVVGLGGAGLYDLIKAAVTKSRGGSPEVEVAEIDRADQDHTVVSVTKAAQPPP